MPYPSYSRFSQNKWTLSDGRVIFLLSLEDFNELPGDTKLIDIFGKEVLKKDADDDTRFGHVAYGLASVVLPC